MTDDHHGMRVVGWTVVGLGFIGASVFRAYVIATLWRWFAVPLGAPAISIAQTYGLLLIVALVTMKLATPKQDDAQDRLRRMAILLGGYLFALLWALGAGAIIHGFVA